MFRECVETREESVRECTESRDEGYSECAESRDEGYHECALWGANCCDWWPCSWACKVVSWFCYGWYWVSNIVCVAWRWVSNIVCVAWAWVVNVVCVAWILVDISIGKAIRFIKEVFWRTVGIIDLIGSLIGIRPLKFLRVKILILSEGKKQIISNAEVQKWVDETKCLLISHGNSSLIFLIVKQIAVQNR